ncbi:MAG: hypothetical protein GMKNLPBB_00311 [Myxococcota bacterium]|nr:hypothetical protein [Myxococcota bacterium]
MSRINQLREFLSADPSDAMTWYLLGGEYRKISDHAQASDAYRRAVQADPAYSVAWQSLTESLLELGDNEAAREAAAQGIAAAEKAGDLMPLKRLKELAAQLG